MRERRLFCVLALLPILASLEACNWDQGALSGPSEFLTGTWSGPYAIPSDPPGRQSMVQLYLTQTDSEVRGDFSLKRPALVNPTVGLVTGGRSGSNVTLSLKLWCDQVLTGTLVLNQARNHMSGTMDGTLCSGQTAHGPVDLDRGD